METYRIAIVDDAPVFVRALTESLEGEPDMEVVGTARDGREALKMVAQAQPDVVLMDLDMPVLDGTAATRAIRQQTPNVEVLVLTVFDDGPHLFAALQAGAKGYLLKNAPVQEIAQAVRDVARGCGALPPALAASVLDEFQRLGQQATRRDDLYRVLTRQETEILRRLARQMTNEQIGRDLFLELSTVKKHVGSVLKKLEVNNRQDAARIAQQVGF